MRTTRPRRKGLQQPRRPLGQRLQQRLRPWPVIAATAALFGLFHIFSPVGLTPERLLTTGLMGIVLGWVRWRSGSVVPGILLHALHNTSIVLLGYYQPRLEAGGWLAGGEKMPAKWLIASAAGAAMGLVMMWWTTRSVANEPRTQ